MPIPIISDVIGAVVREGMDVVDQFVEDKDKAAEMKAQLRHRMQESADRQMQARASIIQAEATGESWLQRNWRPVLMLVIVTIVANNFLVAPYVNALFGTGTVPTLDLPERLWDLMTLGVGGYIVGRSGEKIVKNLPARR